MPVIENVQLKLQKIGANLQGGLTPLMPEALDIWGF